MVEGGKVQLSLLLSLTMRGARKKNYLCQRTKKGSLDRAQPVTNHSCAADLSRLFAFYRVTGVPKQNHKTGCEIFLLLLFTVGDTLALAVGFSSGKQTIQVNGSTLTEMIFDSSKINAPLSGPHTCK